MVGQAHCWGHHHRTPGKQGLYQVCSASPALLEVSTQMTETRTINVK